MKDSGDIMETLYSDVRLQMEHSSEADLKVVQTRTTSEKLNNELVKLFLTCKSSIFGTVVCRLQVRVSESERG